MVLRQILHLGRQERAEQHPPAAKAKAMIWVCAERGGSKTRSVEIAKVANPEMFDRHGKRIDCAYARIDGEVAERGALVRRRGGLGSL